MGTLRVMPSTGPGSPWPTAGAHRTPSASPGPATHAPLMNFYYIPKAFLTQLPPSEKGSPSSHPDPKVRRVQAHSLALLGSEGTSIKSQKIVGARRVFGPSHTEAGQEQANAKLRPRRQATDSCIPQATGFPQPRAPDIPWFGDQQSRQPWGPEPLPQTLPHPATPLPAQYYPAPRLLLQPAKTGPWVLGQGHIPGQGLLGRRRYHSLRERLFQHALLGSTSWAGGE